MSHVHRDDSSVRGFLGVCEAWVVLHVGRLGVRVLEDGLAAGLAEPADGCPDALADRGVPDPSPPALNPPNIRVLKKSGYMYN